MYQSARSGVPLIITADDFGRDAACTAAIAQYLSTRTITAASIMANALHFDEACALVRSERLNGMIGVHLTLDEGPALSREMRPYVNAQGNLCVRRGLHRLGAGLSVAVEAELTAQIARVLAAGIRPTHLDSHRHIHTSFPIGRVVVRLARRFGIPYVRPARTFAAQSSPAATAYKWVFNRYLASRVWTAEQFGDIEDFCRSRSTATASGLIEIMTHLDDSPRGLENRRLLKDEMFTALLRDYQLVGHAQTRH